MSHNGFVQIHRSFLTDPLWLNLPHSYQHIFLTIIAHACFEPTTWDDHGHKIDLMPGQLCTTIREIVSWCGRHISKNEVERCIVKLKLYDFLRQEVRHHKSIITISDSVIYTKNKSGKETRSETTLRQDRDKIETEYKNVKKDKNVKKEDILLAPKVASQRIEASGNSIIFSFESEKFENIRPKDLADWKETYPAVDIEQELKLMVQWLLSNKSKSPKNQFRRFITTWLTKNQNRASQNYQSNRYAVDRSKIGYGSIAPKNSKVEW